MTIPLSASIEQLVARKADLLREVSEIEAELERAMLALQGASVPSFNRRTKPTRNYRRDIRISGSIANDIVTALEIREPRFVKDIAAHLGVSPQAVHQQCVRMVGAGRLSRVRLHVKGRTYMYARTTEALLQSPPLNVQVAENEGAADAEG